MAGFDLFSFADVAGWVGAILILISYIMITSGSSSGRSTLYQSMNVIGAVGLIANGIAYKAFPSVALNLVWVVVGLYALAAISGWMPNRLSNFNLGAALRWPSGWKGWLGHKFLKPAPSITVSSTLISERGRTLDQIKRLYAVIMGFAATECLKNAIFCIRNSSDKNLAFMVFTTFSFVIISMMILFYLGSERYLDRRYLKNNSPEPTRIGLGFDIFNLLITSAWFVYISESFPALSGDKIGAPIELGAESISSSKFISALLSLYVIDFLILSVQLVRTKIKMIDNDNKKMISVAHKIWMTINALSFILASFVIYENILKFDAYQIVLFLFAFHAIRLIVDFGVTIRFYYPMAADSPTDNVVES
ncbi:MAG: hypothetical protein KA482_06280 [Sphingobium sp.]|nr:hypothetical protein [Sphingobium sp.]MBP8671044.1 hypothetical protein [Sphingobium sp.]